VIKLVYCLRRRFDVPLADFHRYWLEQHGPTVRSFAVAVGAKKYVQSHTILPELNEAFRASRNLAPAYDGITELWYENPSALRAVIDSAEGRAAHRALLEDERKFIDFEQSCVFMTEEHLIFDY
jgi:hypothetical protein